MAELWEYKTLALSPTHDRGLVPSLEDGQSAPSESLTDRLNELAKAGWEIQTVIPSGQSNLVHFQTLILRRLVTE